MTTPPDPDAADRPARPLKIALVASLLLFLMGAWVGLAALAMTVVVGAAFAARRHGLALDQGGLLTTRLC